MTPDSKLNSFSAFCLASVTLAHREMTSFFRQRSRVIAALGTPLMFWLVIGGGLGGSFRASAGLDEETFIQYFFPGIVVLTVVFTAIFSTISIIEDKSSGFMQGVLVAPIPRLSLVLGKVIGGTLLSLIQGGLFLLLAPLAGIPLTVRTWFYGCIFIVLIAAAMTGLGFLFAWRMTSIQGFHGIMNLFLMPLWLLSGAVFPAEGAHGWIQALMIANPLSYGVTGLRHMLYLDSAGLWGPNRLQWIVCFGIIGSTALILVFLAAYQAHKKAA